LLVVAVVACQRDRTPSAGSAAGSADPWSALDTPDPDAPPMLPELHRRAERLCPKVTAPYFYRVEKSGATSYLLGTRHISVSLAKFPQVVHDRIADAKLAVFELPPDDRPTKKHPSVHLRDAVGAPLWDHYRELVGHRNADAIEHTRPSLAILRASLLFEDLGATLEHDLQATAESVHVPIRGLETAQFQDDTIEHILDLRMLRAMIETTKDRAEIEDQAATELRDYCTGADKRAGFSDKERAQLHGHYSDAELDAIDEEMVFARNAKWIPDLEQLFDTGGAFVAVGAGHLRGPRGVVELLRARGYTLTRIAE
jgi:uncharacterized protein YbaP (TraB family)